MSFDLNPIVALSTPRGAGALALIRLCGDDALVVADHCMKLSNNQPISAVSSHTIHYGTIVAADSSVIDRVMITVMHAPRTFTGQTTIEITCHNNPFVVDAIIARICESGARGAQAGEFSRRAVLNGKIDLLQAEAVNELIHASSYYALKQSLAQVDGSLSQWVTIVEQELIKALALSEASFEFIDEEYLEFKEQIRTIVDNVLSTITELKKSFDQQQQIRQGIKIALIGSVNAGKSSLFNALLNKQRAIVTNIAGTTRDAIEAGVCRNNLFLTLVDTAGVRETDDIIERQGIERSYQEAAEADIILLVIDGSRVMSVQETAIYTDIYQKHQSKAIVVFNKSDAAIDHRCPLGEELVVYVSCINKSGITELEKLIDVQIEQMFAQIRSPFLLNQRHMQLFTELEQDLLVVNNMLRISSVQYELVSHHLRDAIAQLAQLTGKSISEAGMDAIFREFCVGK